MANTKEPQETSKVDLRDGLKVRFAPSHWGCDIATVVQFRSDVILKDAAGNTFIRELDEIVEAVGTEL